MFFKDFVSVKRQKIKRGASQTYDTPSFLCYNEKFPQPARNSRLGDICYDILLLNYRMWFKYGLKVQKLLVFYLCFTLRPAIFNSASTGDRWFRACGANKAKPPGVPADSKSAEPK